MDDEWLAVYDLNARKEIPLHQMSCWSKQGFEERFTLFKELMGKLDGIKTVLDVGCGPGTYCAYLADAGYEVAGVDYAPAVIELAKKSFPELKFLEANGYALPFEEQSFDLVFSIGALQSLDDYKKFVSELCRTAKKAVLLSTLRRTFRSDPNDELKKQLMHDTWPTRSFHPDEITSLLEEAGFTTQVFTKNGDKLLEDAFFVLATR